MAEAEAGVSKSLQVGLRGQGVMVAELSILPLESLPLMDQILESLLMVNEEKMLLEVGVGNLAGAVVVVARYLLR